MANYRQSPCLFMIAFDQQWRLWSKIFQIGWFLLWNKQLTLPCNSSVERSFCCVFKNKTSYIQGIYLKQLTSNECEMDSIFRAIYDVVCDVPTKHIAHPDELRKKGKSAQILMRFAFWRKKKDFEAKGRRMKIRMSEPEFLAKNEKGYFE